MIEKINQCYPYYKEIITIHTEFKRILKEKNITDFEKWITQTKELNNSYINSFVNGVRRDLEAVKNAIIFEYNNGLAEGSVNKLKVIKRIMYGRNSFEMIRKKS